MIKFYGVMAVAAVSSLGVAGVAAADTPATGSFTIHTAGEPDAGDTLIVIESEAGSPTGENYVGVEGSGQDVAVVGDCEAYGDEEQRHGEGEELADTLVGCL